MISMGFEIEAEFKRLGAHLRPLSLHHHEDDVHKTHDFIIIPTQHNTLTPIIGRDRVGQVGLDQVGYIYYRSIPEKEKERNRLIQRTHLLTFFLVPCPKLSE